jgi:hypothetical protein
MQTEELRVFADLLGDRIVDAICARLPAAIQTYQDKKAADDRIAGLAAAAAMTEQHEKALREIENNSIIQAREARERDKKEEEDRAAAREQMRIRRIAEAGGLNIRPFKGNNDEN